MRPEHEWNSAEIALHQRTKAARDTVPVYDLAKAKPRPAPYRTTVDGPDILIGVSLGIFAGFVGGVIWRELIGLLARVAGLL